MVGPRVVIAHDYLTQRGGAERVVLSLLKAFPDAPIYTTLYNPATTFPEFRDAQVITSGLNRVPLFRNDHRLALPLLAGAANSLRIDADVVIASSSGWAHGFPTTGRKIVYCHSPARFLYLTDEYLGPGGVRTLKGRLLRLMRSPLIGWDQRAARTAHRYLCNSSVIKQRIEDVYGIAADVIAPPAGVRSSDVQEPVEELEPWAGGYYLVVSRLLPYKNVRQVIEAFSGLPDRLVVVGRGPLQDELASHLPENVQLLGSLSDAQLRWTYAHSRGLIAASFEDFGLTPLEAGAFGKPTLALHAGGFLDTVEDGVNGAFFDVPTPAAIRDAVVLDRHRTWAPQRITAHADTFSEERFIQRLQGLVADLI